MATHNYSAWQINENDFSHAASEIDKLNFFARYAILAPSGHNTQPWEFQDSGDKLVLSANMTRVLPYSGVQANEPYVSLGACIETLVLAGSGLGYQVNVHFTLKRNSIAQFSLGKKIKPDPSLLPAILDRVSNRYLYDTENLPDSTLKAVTTNNFSDISVKVLSAEDEIGYVARETDLATHRIFGDKHFRLELSKWVRNNRTKQYDGMPGFVQEIPTPPSMLAKHIIKRINVSKDQSKKDTKRIIASANLIFVNIKNESLQALIDGGRIYARICVLAQQQQLATSGLGTAIIDPQSRTEIIKRFKLDGKPIAIIRIGKAAKQARHTPRWTLPHVQSD